MQENVPCQCFIFDVMLLLHLHVLTCILPLQLFEIEVILTTLCCWVVAVLREPCISKAEINSPVFSFVIIHFAANSRWGLK